jgi:hypothetical protein
LTGCVPLTPLIKTDDAFVVVQANVEDWPGSIVAGFAPNVLITGGGACPLVIAVTSALNPLVTVLLLLGCGCVVVFTTK